MLREPRRLVASLVTVVLGITFLALSLLLGDALWATMRDQAAASVGTAATVVTLPSDVKQGTALPPSGLDPIRTLPGVTGVRAGARATTMQKIEGRQASLVLTTLPQPDRYQVQEGTVPSRPGEIALDATTARVRRLAVGQEVVVTPFTDAGPTALRVVGILATVDDQGEGTPTAFAVPDQVFAMSTTPGYDEVFVDSAADQATVRDAVAAVPAVRDAHLTVRTGHDEIDARIQDYTQGLAQMQGLLLGFAVIALVTATLVITNTFTIVVAQRTRALALLRCVGATRRQVLRDVLGEALLVGGIGSVGGLLLGGALTALAVRVSRGTSMELVAFTPSWWSIVVPLVAGVVLTVACALAPARAATRVAPLAALRPLEPVALRTRGGVVRAFLGTVGALGGTGLLVYGAVENELVPGLVGGAVSLIGVVVLGRWLVPACAAGLSRVSGRLGGLPGELAAENARRNPLRATATALLIGTTIVTLMLVGASSASRTTTAELDQNFPVDAIAEPSTTMSTATYDRMAHTAGVSGAARVPMTTLTAIADGKDHKVDAAVLSTDARRLLRDDRMVDGLGDGTIVAPPDAGLVDGQQVTLRGPGGQTTVTSVVGKDRLGPVITPATLQQVDPQAAAMIWLRFDQGADPAQVVEDVSRAAGTEAQVSGLAAQRDEMTGIVDTMLAVVIGLLAVAVVIAVIGIGNTLSLSVLERTRESGLLRALGLTRGQLRGMLGWEAVVLAAIGTLLGIGLGIGYGIAGVHALAGGVSTVLIVVPWGRLLAVAVVAIAAGWLASVAPGAAAARVSPALALAEE
ncbi:FtsX-like permease family protein [Raineyella sp. LH-20]|uniref:FtsX-like permease family protein n=1 Tax=Raineyella sp. LH-20 TaxID=3081204 RepID=UPI002955BF2D|nr:FtsX-like permease family protein [Raineyella sp. LH-20]WOP19163.1 FtsX-like permease family protein [Raineyella sp. LH-20]